MVPRPCRPQRCGQKGNRLCPYCGQIFSAAEGGARLRRAEVPADRRERLPRLGFLHQHAEQPVGRGSKIDLLHLATAVHLGAKEFLSFDDRQVKLARKLGLATPLV